MLEKGAFIAARYEITEKIGTGGMSDVYKATDVVLGRQVAVKVLKEEFANDENFVSKFRSEASNAAKLEHPNIVNIYDVGSEDGLYYIIMEYVEGITLKTYIEKKGHLNYKEVISIVIQVGRGIEAAHKNQIIHRDIKPQNIIISKEGKVKVTDFGIARAVSSNTVSAEAIGSVHYISPEQARNGYITERSDIYSLGIVMYEMCTGRVPFEGDTAVSIALQHLQGEMKAPSSLVPSVPIALERIIKKSTMKSPDRRYADISELLFDLKKALVNPNEDFVVILDNNNMDKTKIISNEDLDKIKNQSGTKNLSDSDENKAMEGEDEDDDKLNPKMEKAVTIMGIAAGIIIALVLVYMVGSMLGWFNFMSHKKDDTAVEEQKGNIEVPDVLGLSQEEAKEKILSKGLKFKYGNTRTSNKYKKGKACSQSPKSGKKVAKGTVIEVVFSSGESEKGEVPDVVGSTEQDARSLIEDEGYECTIQYKDCEDENDQGKVISQYPKEGSELKKKKNVIIYVGKRVDKPVSVPSVVGLKIESAKSMLQNEGFKVNAIYQEDNVNKDIVIRQDPNNTTAKKGSTVTLIVSKGTSNQNNNNNNNGGNSRDNKPSNGNAAGGDLNQKPTSPDEKSDYMNVAPPKN